MTRPRRFIGVETLSFYAPVELSLPNKLKQICDSSGRKRNGIILEAISDFLKTHHPDHPDLYGSIQQEVENVKKLELEIDTDDLKRLADIYREGKGPFHYRRGLRDKIKRLAIKTNKQNILVQNPEIKNLVEQTLTLLKTSPVQKPVKKHLEAIPERTTIKMPQNTPRSQVGNAVEVSNSDNVTVSSHIGVTPAENTIIEDKTAESLLTCTVDEINSFNVALERKKASAPDLLTHETFALEERDKHLKRSQI